MATLSPVVKKFVLHWGEMGGSWGVNRSVAQIHALLYLASRPLSAEEIAETLSMARSNVSTSLRELESWGVIRTTSVLGDRRQHYESMTDVWEMFRRVMDERRRREIEPTVRVVRECLEEAKHGREDALVCERLAGMLEFFETCDHLYGQVRRLPTNAFIRLFKLGTTLQKLVLSKD